MELDPSLVLVPLIIAAICIIITCWMMQKIIAQLIESTKFLAKVVCGFCLGFWFVYICSVFWTEGMDAGLAYLWSIYTILSNIARRLPKEIIYVLDTVRYAVVQRWNMN
jgi:hypothetical protein